MLTLGRFHPGLFFVGCRPRRRVAWVMTCLRILALSVTLRTAQGQTQRLVPAQDAIPPAYFGMHLMHLIGTGQGYQTLWPPVTVPAWRLWDVRVTWSDLEPAKGKWNFGGLDKILETAKEHNTEVQLTFGFTPKWASTRPTEGSLYQPGGAAEPQSFNDWKDFVRTVAVRYQGQIHIYEIWNEPDVPRYWSGSVEQMIEMTREAHDIIKGVDPSAVIVAPSPTGPNGLIWLSSFLSGGGGNYVDVLGYHFYIFPTPPEAMVPYIQSVEAIMRGNGVANKPLWDTELGWGKPSPFPDEMGAAYLARSYLLNWATGVRRLYWYAWSGGTGGFLSLLTLEPDGSTVKPAGTAFGVIQKWLTGAVMNWCEQDAKQTWTCQLKEHGRDKWIVWNPNQSTCLTLPPGRVVKNVTPLLSDTHSVDRSCIEISPTPELLTQ